MWRPITMLLIALSALPTKADIAVIVNEQAGISSLTRWQVVALYMGRKRNLPNGQPALPLDLATGDPLRSDFYRALTQRNEAQIDAYWAQLVFAGRMTPLLRASDTEAMIDRVRADRSAIAYVAEEDVPKDVTVVLRLDTPE